MNEAVSHAECTFTDCLVSVSDFGLVHLVLAYCQPPGYHEYCLVHNFSHWIASVCMRVSVCVLAIEVEIDNTYPGYEMRLLLSKMQISNVVTITS